MAIPNTRDVASGLDRCEPEAIPLELGEFGERTAEDVQMTLTMNGLVKNVENDDDGNNNNNNNNNDKSEQQKGGIVTRQTSVFFEHGDHLCLFVFTRHVSLECSRISDLP